MLLVFLNRCANRTSACASAALNALVGVDYVFAVALGDTTYGALALASTTSEAIIVNFVSHDNTSNFY